MAGLLFLLQRLPDLSLGKYCALDSPDIGGALARGEAFLRLLHRKGMLSDATASLYYVYDPARPRGDRLDILLSLSGSAEALGNIPQLVNASTLSELYDFELLGDRPFDAYDAEVEKHLGAHYKCFAALKKKEIIASPLVDIGTSSGFDYYTSGWEPNEAGRLYGMLRLLGQLDRPMTYRVDAIPVDMTWELRELLALPIQRLNKRTSSGTRDFAAEHILRNYDELQKSMDGSPQFRAGIYMFANDPSDAALALDAAGTEALEHGSFDIVTFSGDCTATQAFGSDPFPDRTGRFTFIPKHRVICDNRVSSSRLNILPTLFTTEELAPFFRLPALYEAESIEKLKESAPLYDKRPNSMLLGYDIHGHEVYFPLKYLSKHAFIAGMPGAGKTSTMRLFAASLQKNGIPFLILEPAKKEYRVMLGDAGVRNSAYLFSPNSALRFPLHINPFEFPKGVLLSKHITCLNAVFNGVFPLFPPLPYIIDHAIEDVYGDLGWYPDTVNDSSLPYPTLSMLFERLQREMESMEYVGESASNIKGAINMRIGGLLRRELGTIFDVPSSTMPPEEWLKTSAIIELEALSSDAANFMSLILCSFIRELLELDPVTDMPVRHVLFIEEAHSLLGPEAQEKTGEDADPKRAATAFIVKMLAEVRAMGEGIVIADQLPTAIASEVMKNTGLKISQRLTSIEEREAMCDVMGASAAQAEQISLLMPGDALVTYEGIPKPFQLKIARWSELDDSQLYDDELEALLKGNTLLARARERSMQLARDVFSARLDGLGSDVDGLIRLANACGDTCATYRRVCRELSADHGADEHARLNALWSRLATRDMPAVADAAESAADTAGRLNSAVMKFGAALTRTAFAYTADEDMRLFACAAECASGIRRVYAHVAAEIERVNTDADGIPLEALGTRLASAGRRIDDALAYTESATEALGGKQQ